MPLQKSALASTAFVCLCVGAFVLMFSGCGKATSRELKGTYGWRYESGETGSITFIEGHAFQFRDHVNYVDLPPGGTYTIEGKTLVADFGMMKIIYQIVDDQTLSTQAQDGHTYKARKLSEAEALQAAQGKSPARICIEGQEKLDGAIQEWALEHNMKSTDTPTWDNLVGGASPYLKETPKCQETGLAIALHNPSSVAVCPSAIASHAR